MPSAWPRALLAAPAQTDRPRGNQSYWPLRGARDTRGTLVGENAKSELPTSHARSYLHSPFLPGRIPPRIPRTTAHYGPGGSFRELCPEPLPQGLLGLQRKEELAVLNIHHKRIDRVPAHQTPLELQISVCTDGEHQLNQVLDLFSPLIEVVRLQPDNPRDLPSSAAII